MTIVLQHQFWDLTVGEDDFDVGLAFNGIGERLHIPFKAVKAFIDPSVQFAMQFAVDRETTGGTNEHGPAETRAVGTKPTAGAKPLLAPAATPPKPQPEKEPAPQAAPAKPAPLPLSDEEDAVGGVVRLDRFRKK
jgi:hypothetical protein